MASIAVLAAVLRVLALGDLPNGLHPDEAANVVDAVTLARTGRSSDGRAWPLVFPHHGVDWVEGTYTWAAVPTVWACARIEVGVRLPAALAGVLAVVATYYLGRRLGGPRAGTLAALLLAVEPWAFHHSRFGDRASLEPALLAGGLALALRGLEEERRGCALAGGLLLGLGVATYAPARVVVPVVAALAATGTRGSWRARAAALAPVAVALFAVLPFALSEEGLVRLRAIRAHGPLEVAHGYVKHFTTRTLFSGEVGQGFMPRGVPPLLPFEGALVALGLVRAWRDRRWLVGWFLAWPLASALTVPAPNLLRAIFGLPLFALLGGLGAAWLLERLARKRGRRAVLAAIVALAAGSAGHAAWRYFHVFPRERSAWSPYAGERERVAAMRGRVKLTLPHERALVEAYALDRPHRWLGPDEVEFPDE